jgi:hypothetical protein
MHGCGTPWCQRVGEHEASVTSVQRWRDIPTTWPGRRLEVRSVVVRADQDTGLPTAPQRIISSHRAYVLVY